MAAALFWPAYSIFKAKVSHHWSADVHFKDWKWKEIVWNNAPYNCLTMNGLPLYRMLTASSLQLAMARFICILRMETSLGKQTDRPCTRAIAIVRLVRRTSWITRQDGWSGMIRLLARKLSDELPFFAQARPRLMIRLQHKSGHCKLKWSGFPKPLQSILARVRLHS